MNILAIGAHYDDLELGCGGTLNRFIKEGNNVWGFIATSSGYSSPEGKIIRRDSDALAEGNRAAQIIGYELIAGSIPTFEVEANEELQGKLMAIIEKNRIDTVFTHWIDDVHHDHRNLALATLHCTKHIPRLLMYRSNWYPSNAVFRESFYVDISESWKEKRNAISVYAGELERTGGDWIRYYENQAEIYGMIIGTSYAECFECVKWSI